MMLDIFAYVVLSIIVVFLLIGGVSLYFKNAKLVNIIVQSEIDRLALLEELSKVSERAQSLEIQQTDGFLKFISESREWAFDYIEEVQAAIVELHEAMQSSDTGNIDQAYNRLIKFLPDKNPDMVN